MNRRTFAVAAVVIAGCGGNVVLDNATNGTPGTGGTGAGGTGAGVNNVGTTVTSGGGVFASTSASAVSSSSLGTAIGSCDCACTELMSAGGCGDLCDDQKNGNPNTPNYCNGSPALPQCAACLSVNCGFPSEEIADYTFCSGGTTSSSSSSTGGAAPCEQMCAITHPAAYQKFLADELQECACAANGITPCSSACPAQCAGTAQLTVGSPCGQCILAQADMTTSSPCTVKAALTDCQNDPVCVPFPTCVLGCPGE